MKKGCKKDICYNKFCFNNPLGKLIEIITKNLNILPCQSLVDKVQLSKLDQNISDYL